MAKEKEKRDWSIGILAAVVIPLLGVAVTLFAVFYEKPKTFLPNPLLDQAEVLLIEEKYDEAITKAEESKVVEPDNPRIYLVIYAANELSDRHEEAVQALRDGTEQVKKRATGGKEIRAVLEAAEVSPEEGLATVADVYRSETFNLKPFALRLLEVLVKVFEGVERFVRALAELKTEIYSTTPTETSAEAQPADLFSGLEEEPISEEEYAQVKAFLETPSSLDNLLSRFVMNKDKLIKGSNIDYDEYMRFKDEAICTIETHEIKKLSVDGVKQFLAIYESGTKDTGEYNNSFYDCRLPLDGTNDVYRVSLTLQMRLYEHEEKNTDITWYIVNQNGSYKIAPILNGNMFAGIS